jgi:hypothetical protein
MAFASAITTPDYKLFPSPRNIHRVVFSHQVFLPHPYMLIDMASYGLKGRYSLFAAHRLADSKAGQLATFETESDEVRFRSLFVPD